MKYEIVEMTLEKYEELMDFWRSIEGIYMSYDDDYENLRVFLERNPRLNYIALDEDKIIAAIKCSHDGRRGYIHHLGVKTEYRNQGIARELIHRCLNNLREQGIRKYRVFVMDDNKEAMAFWKHAGFEEQVYDYRTFQMNVTQ